jgi:hypothetical protein
MDKRIIKLSAALIIFLIILIFFPAPAEGQNELPTIAQAQEGRTELLILDIPFNHVGEIPNLGASKINMTDITTNIGKDYTLSGVGIVHNIKTGYGLARLELIIVDDGKLEETEEFVVVLDLGDKIMGGKVLIIDNDGI